MVDSPQVPRRPPAREPVVISGSTDRQIGEVVATLREQRENIAEIKESIEVLANVQRNQQDGIRARLELLERTQHEQTRVQTERHQANTDALTKLTTEVTGLKDPVSAFVSLRKRAGTSIMVLGTVISVIWMLAQPIYTFLLTRLFPPH